MIYIIKNKPHIKVANYYKEVEVSKDTNGYNITANGKSIDENDLTREERINIPVYSVEDYYNRSKTSSNKSSKKSSTEKANTELKLSKLSRLD